MKSYQVSTKIEVIYHNFLKKLAKKNDTTISEIVKKLIENCLYEYNDHVYKKTKLNLEKEDKIKKVIIERISDDDDEKIITVKLGMNVHNEYKKYCVDKGISMKKMTRKIIKRAYKLYK